MNMNDTDSMSIETSSPSLCLLHHS